MKETRLSQLMLRLKSSSAQNNTESFILLNQRARKKITGGNGVSYGFYQNTHPLSNGVCPPDINTMNGVCIPIGPDPIGTNTCCCSSEMAAPLPNCCCGKGNIDM